ncbi:hypothetical protein V8O11_24120 [Erwinia aphidicola]|uniref:Uncharacterized protein n=1 Tax=Erwinia aphidicola TaxID=68334 RepID=A0ABU8DPG4_ERWAP
MNNFSSPLDFFQLEATTTLTWGVITPAFPDKFFIRFIKMKITRQLKFIRFAGESAITLSLLSGQKINGHIDLPA